MPRIFLPFFLALSAAVLATGCASKGESTAQTLYGREITETLVGNSLHRTGGGWFSSWEYTGYHRDDGTMTGRVSSSGGDEDVDGTWEIGADRHYCRTWSNEWAGGERGCFRVTRKGDALIFDHISGASGGADRYIYKFLPGNPQEL